MLAESSAKKYLNHHNLWRASGGTFVTTRGQRLSLTACGNIACVLQPLAVLEPRPPVKLTRCSSTQQELAVQLLWRCSKVRGYVICVRVLFPSLGEVEPALHRVPTQYSGGQGEQHGKRYKQPEWNCGAEFVN